MIYIYIYTQEIHSNLIQILKEMLPKKKLWTKTFSRIGSVLTFWHKSGCLIFSSVNSYQLFFHDSAPAGDCRKCLWASWIHKLLIGIVDFWLWKKQISTMEAELIDQPWLLQVYILLVPDSGTSRECFLTPSILYSWSSILRLYPSWLFWGCSTTYRYIIYGIFGDYSRLKVENADVQSFGLSRGLSQFLNEIFAIRKHVRCILKDAPSTFTTAGFVLASRLQNPNSIGHMFSFGGWDVFFFPRSSRIIAGYFFLFAFC